MAKCWPPMTAQASSNRRLFLSAMVRLMIGMALLVWTGYVYGESVRLPCVCWSDDIGAKECQRISRLPAYSLSDTQFVSRRSVDARHSPHPICWPTRHSFQSESDPDQKPSDRTMQMTPAIMANVPYVEFNLTRYQIRAHLVVCSSQLHNFLRP